jgi:molecular chaperone GrpE
MGADESEEAKKGVEEEDFQQRLDDLRKECEDNSKLASDRLTQLQYLQADFENLQKRLARETAETIAYASEDLIVQLLPVLDSLEKAIEAEKDAKHSKGLSSLHNQIYGILEKNGLKRIKAVGEKFDPYYHEALLTEKSQKEEGIVLDELQAGYMLNNKVIRHSKVKISGGK